MDKAYNWLLLSSVKGIGESTLKLLLDKFHSSEGILSAKEEELANVIGVRKARLLRAKEGVSRKKIEDVLKVANREGIGIITPEDSSYPKEFFELPNPPPVIFFRGSLKHKALVGVVGSRKPSDYTNRLVDEIVDVALKNGFGTVSGGAMGVDSRAHFRTIEKSGYTVCILGFGILKATHSLFRKIEKSNGVLISEFLPEEPASRYTFPKRNRLIGALSRTLIVPEASSRSGALITAEWAFNLGREVYAHIGMGRSPRWAGCYRLIREGKAQIFAEPQDIFQDKEPQSSHEPLMDFMSSPRSLDEIAEFLKCSYGDALSLLGELEAQGKIVRMGAFYVAC